ncbi:trypsin beta-like [Drosophila eugracilis]|uniref:trypsin beta-like n=1 Tax=Drosophila eugracilis TaxID=29029 RepID=UPI001BDAAA0C|nr:trypsin beta-like [Drosophila eugracilis]
MVFNIGHYLLLAIALLSIPGAPGLSGVERITHGRNIDITQVPWQVSLHYLGKLDCGGSIYSETIIITAAHCVENRRIGDIEVRAGSSNHRSGGVLVKVENIRYHEKYNNQGRSDVAVIKLRTPLTFSNTIQPIALAEQDPAEGSLGLATGWGLTPFYNPDDLRGVKLTIRSWEWCKIKYPYFLLDDDICAGSALGGPCNGDSGGPLVVDGKLVGITSRAGNFLCLSSGLFASVARYRSWILNAIKSV